MSYLTPAKKAGLRKHIEDMRDAELDYVHSNGASSDERTRLRKIAQKRWAKLDAFIDNLPEKKV